jgi:hypothetical protein
MRTCPAPTCTRLERDGRSCETPFRGEETIIVDDEAILKAHIAHGDSLGECGTVLTTLTLSSPTTTSVPITETDPPTTTTLPGETTTTGITVTVSVPGETTTAPGTTTVVTVPEEETTTVTLPGQTVTKPPVTTTMSGEIIERQPETVTLPGATTTVAAAGTTTVVTVTVPNEIVHPGVVVKKPVQAKIKQPRRLVHVAGRIHRLRARVRFLATKVIVIVHRTLIVVSRAARSCPPGTKPFKGTCRAAVRGKG